MCPASLTRLDLADMSVAWSTGALLVWDIPTGKYDKVFFRDGDRLVEFDQPGFVHIDLDISEVLWNRVELEVLR